MSSQLPDLSLPPLPLEIREGGDTSRMIVVAGNGTTTLAYEAGPGEHLTVRAVSVDIPVGPVTQTTTVTVTVTDAAGNVVAVAQTDANTWTDETSQVTFGNGLPDTRQFSNDYGDTNAQTGMPPAALDGGGAIAVAATGDALEIAELRLWVDDLDAGAGSSSSLSPRLAHRPLTGV